MPSRAVSRPFALVLVACCSFRESNGEISTSGSHNEHHATGAETDGGEAAHPGTGHRRLAEAR
jgi:hypothetical protein